MVPKRYQRNVHKIIKIAEPLEPSQLASLYEQRRPVTDDQFRFAKLANQAFATQDLQLFAELSRRTTSHLPWIPPAVARWLCEQPDPASGLGQLESLALQAISGGGSTLMGQDQRAGGSATLPDHQPAGQGGGITP